MTNIHYLNGTLAEIAELPEKNIYHFILSRIEQRVNAGEITEDQESEMQLKLIADYEQAQRLSRKITVIDSIMGSGKTTYILNFINNNPMMKFICVVPYITEIERYKDAIQCDVYDPEIVYRDGKANKQNGFQELIRQGRNIVTTHSLVSQINKESIDLLKSKNYILIHDECLDVVHPYNDDYKFKKSDLKMLRDSGSVDVNDDGFLKWNLSDTQDDKYNGRFNDVKNLCNLNALMVPKKKDGSFSDQVLIWCMPKSFFDLFEHCYICTHLFEGSLRASDFKLHGIRYETKSLLNGVLIPYDRESERLQRQENMKLMKVTTHGKFSNDDVFSTSKNPFTETWYKNQLRTERGKQRLEQLKKNCYNFFTNIAECNSKESMWTCYKSFKNRIAPKSYGRNSFVECSCKGTNDYADRKAVAYLINFYPSGDIVNYFNSYGVEVNKELYALSAMLQWIWRSRIRNGKTIFVYIPSKRMRDLLADWVLCEI